MFFTINNNRERKFIQNLKPTKLLDSENNSKSQNPDKNPNKQELKRKQETPSIKVNVWETDNTGNLIHFDVEV